MKSLLLLLAVHASSVLIAQEVPAIVREQWDAKPALHRLSSELEKEPAVIVADKRRIEYIDVKDDQLTYRTIHRIVHVNDDRGIESFNKIYLPVNENGLIVDIRARTILPNGKVIELNKSDIKEIKEDETTYKIFALEGLVKGCEIEYFYTYNSDFSFFGREVVQGAFHIIDADVEIVSPARLVFELKPFNGLGTVVDSVIGEKKFLRVSAHNIEGVDEEKYAMYTANLKRAEYKLSYNKARSSSERLFTWNDLAKRVYSLNNEFTEKELKEMKEVVQKNKWAQLASEKEKIIAVENYLKNNIASRNDINSDQAENIIWILKNKICSERGMVRLFGAAYTVLGINYEHVVAGSRETFVLDRSFENWVNCNNSLIYFPSLQKFIAPATSYVRYPWIDPSWAGSLGVFCKPTTIGNFTSAIAYVKSISFESPASSQINIEAVAELNSSMDALELDFKQLHTGYSSTVYRRIFNYNSEEDQKEIIKDMVKRNLGTEKILQTNIQNKEFEHITENKPFIFATKVQAPALVEKAGNRVLVKVGEIIGPQVEMYQEKKRKMPVEIEYPHLLARKIAIRIPKGYKVKNVDDLKWNNVVKENDEVSMGFESTVEINGDLITVNIMEQYNRINYPVEQYEQFQKIINAAADFNKVVLVLEKI
jgi:hypothetical protein